MYIYLFFLYHFLFFEISWETATSRHKCYLRKVTHIPAQIYCRRTPCPHLGRAAIRHYYSPWKPVHHRCLHPRCFRTSVQIVSRGEKYICVHGRHSIYCSIAVRPKNHAGRLNLCIIARAKRHRVWLVDNEVIPRYERLMARSTRVLIGWWRCAHSGPDWLALRTAVNNDWLMVPCPVADWLMVESS